MARPRDRRYEAGAELADRRGASGAGDWARMQSMWTRYDLGAWDEVLEIGERVLVNDAEGAGQVSVLAEIYRRDVLLHRGLFDPEDAVETTLVPRASEIGDGQRGVLIPEVLGPMLAEAPDPELARIAISRVAEDEAAQEVLARPDVLPIAVQLLGPPETERSAGRPSRHGRSPARLEYRCLRVEETSRSPCGEARRNVLSRCS